MYCLDLHSTRQCYCLSLTFTHHIPNLNPHGLQSIHWIADINLYEADGFDDIYHQNMFHLRRRAFGRNAKRSCNVLEDIFGNSDEDHDDEGEPHSNPLDDEKTRLI
eukprot:615836_1